jgi:leader peptidase (prepilin peptidase) / N-methyltransferase
MWAILRFVAGCAIGSFLNVLAVRYDPDRFLLTRSTVGGRSRCPHCRETLRWFELIPLVSFAVQHGRCRRCRARLSLQYPVAELLSGLILLGVPWLLGVRALSFPVVSLSLVIAWIVFFEVLLTIALIDWRLKLIPDEATILLTILGIAIAVLGRADFGQTSGSFLGPYALIFGLRDAASIWMNRFGAVVVGLALFGGLIAVTRSRGMGVGDLKLSVPLAIAFGWPDAFIIFMLAFVIGAVVGVAAVLRHTKQLKSLVPFGPFLAVAAVVVFAAGEPLIRWYFGIMGLGA